MSSTRKTKFSHKTWCSVCTMVSLDPGPRVLSYLGLVVLVFFILDSRCLVFIFLSFLVVGMSCKFLSVFHAKCFKPLH